MCDFFNPKNVTIGSGVDQNKKLPSFCPIGQKPPILHENLVIRTISHVKWVVFVKISLFQLTFLLFRTCTESQVIFHKVKRNLMYFKLSLN